MALKSGYYYYDTLGTRATTAGVANAISSCAPTAAACAIKPTSTAGTTVGC
jgi:hypothetical protein